jgi:hypothetical protein
MVLNYLDKQGKLAVFGGETDMISQRETELVCENQDRAAGGYRVRQVLRCRPDVVCTGNFAMITTGPREVYKWCPAQTTRG